MSRMSARVGGRVRAVLARRWQLAAEDIWPLLQGTAAATIAWLIAKHVVDHREPFFAPIAALVSLNASMGERGLNALRLLQGVVLGIVVGELSLLVLGGGYGSLALATFVALLLARMLGGTRIVLSQAGIGAILTIAVGNGQVGPQRITDALIGAGVALVFSQLLFSPQPLRLLRRFETNALKAMAAALELTAQALSGDEALADRAIRSLRDLRDQLSELGRMRRVSTLVARRTVPGRNQLAPVVHENEDAGHLDLLGGSCLLLTRTSFAAGNEDRRLLAPGVHALSTTLAGLAQRPGDRATRQAAVEDSLDVLRGMRSLRAEPDPELTAALGAARIAVTDLMLFVGVDPEEAHAATREEASENQKLEVPPPPSVRRPGLLPFRRWLPRRFRGTASG